MKTLAEKVTFQNQNLCLKVHIAQVTIYPTKNVRPVHDVVPLCTTFLYSLQKVSQHSGNQSNISESTLFESPY